MDTNQRLLAELESGGLLLVQDRSFPNVVSLVTGETLRGSWWAHPRCHEIFRCLTAVAEASDVLVTKLIQGKVTFVHRRLWKAVLSAAMARDPWQVEGLSPTAAILLEQVERDGTAQASGPESAELEQRLLVHGDQIHTESEKHKTRLETWPAWSLRSGCVPGGPAELGRSDLERTVRDLGLPLDGLPWRAHNRRKGKHSPSANREVSP